MTPEIIILIVLSSLNMLTGLISPLITASSYLITHIRKSECCGSKLEVDRSNDDLTHVENKELKEKEKQMSRFDNVHELSADIVVNQMIQNMRKESNINESDLIDALKRISNNNLRKSGNYNSVDLTDDDNDKKRNSKNKRNPKHDN